MVKTKPKSESPFRTIYPFKSHFMTIEEHQYHFVDEGQGEVIIMLHGNPTWSFYYRNLIKLLKNNYRVIVPDHMGCGLSDKPKDYTYNLETHISNVLQLISFLKIEKFRLVVHDWGGAIGFGVASRLKEKVKNIVILNTAAFLSQDIPKRIAFCRTSIGGFLVQAANAFAWPATFMASTKPLSPLVKSAYLFPYDTFDNRIAIRAFVEDIPMEKEHETYQVLEKIESQLPELTCPKLIIWGGRDFCFNDKFFNKWVDIYPDARAVYLKDVGHYVLEDAFSECYSEIKEFYQDNEHS